MHKFNIAIETLDSILKDGVPFNLATKNTLDKYSVPLDERSDVTGVIGCELRHHLLFETLINDAFQVEEGKEFSHSGLLLALANYHFYQKFDKQEVVALVSKSTNLDKKAIEDFLEANNDRNDLIPSRFQKGSFEYLSLRYNCPVWLVKMLNKHYGRGLAFKVLQTNTKPLIQSYKLINIDQGKILLDPSFGVSPVEGMVNYVGKGTARNTEPYKKKQILPERMAFKDSLDKFNFKAMPNIAVYSSYPNTMFVDLANRIEGGHIDLVVPDITTYNDAKKLIAIYGLKNISLYEEKAANLLACISNKVDYFFMLARNSNFDLLRTNADYFLRFNRDNLDSIMNEQRYSLEEAASLIAEGGELIYMIPTLNKKESKQIVTEFLLIHKDFSLLEEKQYFPFEDLNSTLYFARMIKVK